MKYIILIMCIFNFCVSKEVQTIKVENAYQALFSERLKDKYLSDEVDSLMQIIINGNDANKFDSIQKFLLTNERYSFIGLYYLIMNNYNGLADWLNTNCGILSEKAWISLPSKFGARVPIPVSSEIQIALFRCIMNLTDAYRRQQNLVILNHISGYKCTELALKQLLCETDKDVRIELYVMMTKFNTPEFNIVLKKLISDRIELDAIECVNNFGFEKYNRYDFLPELKQVEAELRKEKDPAKIGLQKSLVEQLEKTIPILEKKKAENVPIGLPLDWPGDSK